MWYVIMYAILLELSSAVNHYGRFSKFLEAAGRRVATVMWVMYVDDGALTDLTHARDSSQVLMGTVFEQLGANLSEQKATHEHHQRVLRCLL